MTDKPYYATLENKENQISITRFESELVFNNWYNTPMLDGTDNLRSDVYAIMYTGYDEKKAEAACDRRRTIDDDLDDDE